MKKFAIGASVFLNLVVLAVGIWAFTGGLVAFFISSFIEPAHERWVTQFEQLPVMPGDTVFLGDSITEGGSWHELFPDSEVRNRGIGGDVTTGVLARLDQITAGKPGQVFLLIGTNDLAFGRSEPDIVRNIVTILDRIETVSPGTKTYVQSVLPRDVEYRRRIESLNKAIAVAIEGKAIWIDLYPDFLSEDGSITDELANDELHLLGSGYLVWRNRIQSLVTTVN
ncbi:MAG: hypothetical protein HOC23_12800 [Halieaceae bacterium]|jgi:lysophospholipase L1-like esterase|nr:hypothetical protein [Halieaceae bacterium]